MIMKSEIIDMFRENALIKFNAAAFSKSGRDEDLENLLIQMVIQTKLDECGAPMPMTDTGETMRVPPVIDDAGRQWIPLYTNLDEVLNGNPTEYTVVLPIRDLVEESKRFQAETGSPLKLSVHLCELSVKGLIREEEFYPYFEPILEFLPHFQRMQLNAIFEHLTAYWDSLPEKLRKLPCSPQIIIQYNGKEENKAIYNQALKSQQNQKSP